MIRTIDRPEAAAAFCWPLCGRMETRSYTLFENREAMTREFAWSAAHEEGLLLGCYEQDELTGVVSAFSSDGGLYAQTTGLYAESRRAMDALLEALRLRYPRARLYIGIPEENSLAVDALTRRGCVPAEASMDTRLERGAYSPFREEDLPQARPEQINAADFDAYAPFHDRMFPMCYWTSERIRPDMDAWHIVALREGKAYTGAMCTRINRTQAEIFALSARDRRAADALLASLAGLFEDHAQVRDVVFFIDRQEPAYMLDAARQAGFQVKSHYVMYEWPAG